MSDDQWGPWIDHDGKGCPCVGQYVHVVFEYGLEIIAIAGSQTGNSWNWSNAPLWLPIIRYRVRKPRALIELIEMVENLPAPSQPKVPA